MELLALEFDWIFRGDFAIKFISSLAESENDELFAIDTIRIMIEFLWSKFFWGIMFKIFIPFIIYTSTFIFYVTFIFQTHREIQEDRQYQLNHFNFNPNLWYGLDIAFLIVSAVGVAFFAVVELRQLKYGVGDYIQDFWNCLDLISLSINAAFIICDLSKVETHTMRALGSACVLFLWIKFYYFMRLFSATARFIRMIQQVIIDIFAFGMAFVFCIMAIGQTYFILAQNSYLLDEPDTLFSGANYMQAIIFAYENGLLFFQVDSYDDDFAGQFEWFVFYLNTILITIILLNLLIGLMGDTYDNVNELGEKSKLQELCAMISENEFVINRSKEFAHSRYIIIARLEQAELEKEDIG